MSKFDALHMDSNRQFEDASLSGLDRLCEDFRSSGGLSSTFTMPAVMEVQNWRQAEKWKWLSTRKLLADAVTLAGMLPLNCGGILAIPRSGLLPATVIATQLHLPLYVLEDSSIRRCRAQRGRSIEIPRRGDLLVVVDDSVYQGNALAMVRQGLSELKYPLQYAAVYSSPEFAHLVDYCVEEKEWPFLAEWNLVNNRGWADALAFDLDGIIVHDDLSGGRPGTPYLVPRNFPVELIVTGRPETMREATHQQLRQLGVQFKRLEMMPGNAWHTWGTIAKYKAEVYSHSSCKLFLESDPDQAEDIAQLSEKAVACPKYERVFNKSKMDDSSFLPEKRELL